MHLTQQTALALQTLAYCAASPSTLNRVSEVAEAQGISRQFLVKLIRPLVRNGLLKTVRGRGGGIGLRRPADEITLLEIVRMSEGEFVLAECFRETRVSCPLADGCDLNLALHKALDAFFDVLGRYTLADLLHRAESPKHVSGPPPPFRKTCSIFEEGSLVTDVDDLTLTIETADQSR